MIFCQECGYKSPDHKPNCSQAGGPGATPRNTYTERQDTVVEGTSLATAIIDELAPEPDQSPGTTTTDTSTSTGE